MTCEQCLHARTHARDGELQPVLGRLIVRRPTPAAARHLHRNALAVLFLL